MTWADHATASLIARLDATADERTREHWTTYLKGAASFRGVPMAGVRAAVRSVIREHDLPAHDIDELVDLAVRWTTGSHTEDKLAAVLLLAEHLAPQLRMEHAHQLARPLQHGALADWNVVDWYATKALNAYLTAGGAGPVADRAAVLVKWAGASSLWQRRAGLVAFARTAGRPDRHFPGYTGLVLTACAANLVDADRFAHTGPGWVLRELSRTRPELVAGFVDAHPELSAEGRRMATALLRAGPYRRR